MAPYTKRTTTRLYTAIGFSSVSFALGLGPFISSTFFSELYGLDAVTPAAIGYQQALGVRDLAFGSAYLISALVGDSSAIDTLLISQGLIGVGDALVVWLNDGDMSKVPAHLTAGLIATGLGVWLRWRWPDHDFGRKTD